jgi:hypothetical protein
MQKILHVLMVVLLTTGMISDEFDPDFSYADFRRNYYKP